MSRYTKTTKKRYFCGFHCVQCGYFNTVTALMTVRYSKSLLESREKRIREETVRKEYQMLRGNVNVLHKNYTALMGLSGVCHQCGKRQPWAMTEKENRHELGIRIFFGLMIAAYLISLLVNRGARFMNENLYAILGFAACFALVSFLGKFERKRIEGRDARVSIACRQATEWNCFPYVMDETEPVDPEDERSVMLDEARRTWRFTLH